MLAPERFEASRVVALRAGAQTICWGAGEAHRRRPRRRMRGSEHPVLLDLTPGVIAVILHRISRGSSRHTLHRIPRASPVELVVSATPRLARLIRDHFARLPPAVERALVLATPLSWCGRSWPYEGRSSNHCAMSCQAGAFLPSVTRPGRLSTSPIQRMPA